MLHLCTEHVPPLSSAEDYALQVWHGRIHSIGHLHVFGFLAHSLVPWQQHTIQNDDAAKLIFSRSSKNSKGCCFNHLQAKTILEHTCFCTFKVFRMCDQELHTSSKVSKMDGSNVDSI